MQVFGLVRIAVVVAVMGSPPQRTALGAGLRQECEHELKHAAGLVGAVGKVSVVDTGHREHADEVQRHAADGRRRGDTGPDGSESEQMDGNEGRHAQPADFPRCLCGSGHRNLMSLIHRHSEIDCHAAILGEVASGRGHHSVSKCKSCVTGANGVTFCCRRQG
jgi:hypothetical protein